MRISTFFSAALLAVAPSVSAVHLQIYNDSDDCTGPVIEVTTLGCHNIESRGSARVLSGGAWGVSDKECKGFRTGVFRPEQGCFSTYPVFFSWQTVGDAAPPPPPRSTTFQA
jgi:hypothetical protein